MLENDTILGYGKSHASFGEIIQGRLPQNVDFLVTLPIDLWSICDLVVKKKPGPLIINCDFYKSKKVAKILLNKLNIKDGFEININFNRNVPVGKGLSSSTADMLSTVRSLQETFGFLLREKTISEIFNSIEPHDGLMYKSCTIYNHRKGELIKELLYIPAYWIIGIDIGGTVDTVEYNKNITFDNNIILKYKSLLEKLCEAFDNNDDVLIAKCASESTDIHINMHGDMKRKNIISSCQQQFDPLGVINTHSGTCLGLLFPKTISLEDIKKIAVKIKNYYGYPTTTIRTLKLLA